MAHLVGGLEPARTIMLKLLESGKDIVTANKALLAEHGPELFDRARELGRSIAFEASVAGGIPIIANISQCLSANQIQSIHAILNGTSNFILTQMEEHGTAYAAAVRRGPAAGLCRGRSDDGRRRQRRRPEAGDPGPPGLRRPRPLERHSPRRASTRSTLADLRYAKELGYRIKLLAVAQLDAGGLGTARLADAGQARHAAGRGPRGLQRHPRRGRRRGPRVLPRPGRRADADRLGRRGRPDRHGRRPHGDHLPHARTVVASTRPRVAAATMRNVSGRFYLRFNVADQPGVLAEIAGVLGKHNISIASVIQHEAEEGSQGVVPLVIMTHNTTEGAMRRAIDGHRPPAVHARPQRADASSRLTRAARDVERLARSITDSR